MIELTVDGARCTRPRARASARALLDAGPRARCATARAGSPRGLYCGIGVCQECRVVVDGVVVRACVTPVARGHARHHRAYLDNCRWARSGPRGVVPAICRVLLRLSCAVVPRFHSQATAGVAPEEVGDCDARWAMGGIGRGDRVHGGRGRSGGRGVDAPSACKIERPAGLWPPYFYEDYWNTYTHGGFNSDWVAHPRPVGTVKAIMLFVDFPDRPATAVTQVSPIDYRTTQAYYDFLKASCRGSTRRPTGASTSR